MPKATDITETIKDALAEDTSGYPMTFSGGPKTSGYPLGFAKDDPKVQKMKQDAGDPGVKKNQPENG